MNKKALQVCIKSAKLLLCGLKIIILLKPKVPDGHIGLRLIQDSRMS